MSWARGRAGAAWGDDDGQEAGPGDRKLFESDASGVSLVGVRW